MGWRGDVREREWLRRWLGPESDQPSKNGRKPGENRRGKN